MIESTGTPSATNIAMSLLERTLKGPFVAGVSGIVESRVNEVEGGGVQKWRRRGQAEEEDVCPAAPFLFFCSKQRKQDGGQEHAWPGWADDVFGHLKECAVSVWAPPQRLQTTRSGWRQQRLIV